MNRPGLTLLELVVVLAILAVLATVAVVSMEGTVDQARYDATVKQLQAIDDAILGPVGQPDAASFVADVGRLPRYSGNADDPFPELTSAAAISPPQLLTFAQRAAPQDPAVKLYGGWRGPYLKQPSGQSRYLDGWGNRFEFIPQPLSTPQQQWIGDFVGTVTSLGGSTPPYAGNTLNLPETLAGSAWTGIVTGNVKIHFSGAGNIPAKISIRLFVTNADSSSASGVSMIYTDQYNSASPKSDPVPAAAPDPMPVSGFDQTYPFSFSNVPAAYAAIRVYEDEPTANSVKPLSSIVVQRIRPRGAPATTEIQIYIK